MFIKGYIKDQEFQNKLFEILKLREQDKLVRIINNLIREKGNRNFYIIIDQIEEPNKFIWVLDEESIENNDSYTSILDRYLL